MTPYYTNATNGSFYVEDYAGHSAVVPLPFRAMQPDIVLANSPDISGNPGYQALVVYYEGTNSSFTGDAYLEIYDLVNVGLPTFTPVLRGTRIRLTNFCNGFPHIDMFSDANNPVNGLPGLHKFAIVYAENGASGDLMLCVNEVNTPTASIPYIIGTNAYMPDLACLTDVGTGAEYVELAFGQGFGTPFMTTIGGALYWAEYDLSWIPGSTITPAMLDPRSTYAPKIEAMSQFDRTSGAARWQIAVSIATVAGRQVLGYNDLTVGGTDMSSLLAVLYPVPPWTGYQAMGACVAAGIHPSYSPNIGNQQYTVGFYPWQHDSIYARDVSAMTGTLLTPVQCYQINSVGAPLDYNWDLNQSLAVSNCSNSGRDLLSAWCDGANMVYKYSSPNVMAFKPGRSTSVNLAGNARSGGAPYPNPVKDMLFVSGSGQSDYTVIDIAGRVLLRGTCAAAGPIDVSRLHPGIYLLRTSKHGNPLESVKFTKE